MVTYSPSLILWLNQKTLWMLVCKKLSGDHVSSWHLCHLTKCSHVAFLIHLSCDAAHSNLVTTNQEYQSLQPKATQLWTEFLQQKLLDPGLLEDHLKAISQILHCEGFLEAFHAICQTKNVQPMRSIFQMEIWGPDNLQVYSTQQTVKQNLSEALALRFQLTAHPLLSQTPLLQKWPPWYHHNCKSYL